MKFFFSLILISVGVNLNAQIFDFTTEWFHSESFFVETEVEKRNIKSIHISKSEKLDGQVFKDENALISYHFLTNGKVQKVEKYLHHFNRIDTSNFIFYYSKSNILYKKVEQEGPFEFSYFYVYEDDLLSKELKANTQAERLDTSYQRYYIYKNSENEQLITHLNSVHKPFKIEKVKRDLFNQLISHKTDFVRNSNFLYTEYDYQLQQLNTKKVESYIGTQMNSEKWEYHYKNGFVDLINQYSEEVLTFKFAFLYSSTLLPKTIIERDVEKKSVSIYKLTYEYF